MFAVCKIVAAFALACASVIAAIVESGHPALFGCLFVAFIAGAVAAEAVWAHRKDSVRSLVN